ncbi:MAG: hypothetical protein AAF288_00825 [Planctomycetota bacterium]
MGEQGKYAELLKQFRGVATIAAGITLAWPWLFHAGVLIQWLMAFSELGHPPVAWRDDPMWLPWSGQYYWITQLMFLAAIPIALPVSFLAAALSAPTLGHACIRCYIAIINWGLVLTWTIWDPFRLFAWWLD